MYFTGTYMVSIVQVQAFFSYASYRAAYVRLSEGSCPACDRACPVAFGASAFASPRVGDDRTSFRTASTPSATRPAFCPAALMQA